MVFSRKIAGLPSPLSAVAQVKQLGVILDILAPEPTHHHVLPMLPRSNPYLCPLLSTSAPWSRPCPSLLSLPFLHTSTHFQMLALKFLCLRAFSSHWHTLCSQAQQEIYAPSPEAVPGSDDREPGDKYTSTFFTPRLVFRVGS